jgi:predicted transposase/invertase (TIGR01784 family)
MTFSKYFNPKNDVAFKRIFGTEKNKDILISLLNEVLQGQLKNRIEEVQFLKTIQDPCSAGSKQSIVDVLCRDREGVQYIIEMQVAQEDGFQARAQYYAARAYTSQMKIGGIYQELKAVIFIAFCDFELFSKKKGYKSEHMTLDIKSLAHDLDKFSFTFIELQKFNASIAGKDPTMLSTEEKFYYFLSNASAMTPDEFAKLIEGSEVIERACNELDQDRKSVV